MDERNCRSPHDTQLVEKNNMLPEIVMKLLLDVKALLDRSMHCISETDIIEASEHLDLILKTIQRMPSEIKQTHIRSYSTLRQGVRNIMIELTIALDLLSIPEQKVSFYDHLLLAKEYFTEIFAAATYEDSIENEDYAEAPSNMDSNELNPIISFPARADSLLDFSKKVLPDIQMILHNPDSIDAQQYEHICKNMQLLDELFEKQKKICKSVPYADDTPSSKLYRRLIVNLSYASELRQRLICLLSTLHSKPYPRAKRSAQIRGEILYAFTLFMHNFDNVLQQTQRLTIMQQQEHFLQTGTDREGRKVIPFPG